MEGGAELTFQVCIASYGASMYSLSQQGGPGKRKKDEGFHGEDEAQASLSDQEEQALAAVRVRLVLQLLPAQRLLFLLRGRQHLRRLRATPLLVQPRAWHGAGETAADDQPVGASSQKKAYGWRKK